MNVANLVQAGLLGFLCSLVLLEVLARLVGRRWPVQSAGFQLEFRLLPWVLAVLAGPALFFEATAPYRRMRAGQRLDGLLVWALLAVWSASYGTVLHLAASLV